jgi:hypothetical protein
MATYYVYAMRLGDGRLDFGSHDRDPRGFVSADALRVVWRVEGAGSGPEALAAVLLRAADQWIGSDIAVSREIPRERTAHEELDRARNVMRADYWDDVRSVVEDVKGEIANGNLADRDAVDEYLDERIDSQHRIIYTYAAMETVMFSENDGAYEEHFGAEGLVEDGQVQWSRLAFYAMLEDVRDQLGDVDELLAEASTECGLCGAAFAEDDETEIYVDQYGDRRKDHVECPDEEEDANDDAA